VPSALSIFWGQEKREALHASLAEPQAEPNYAPLIPAEENWFRLRRWDPRHGYQDWPAGRRLAAEKPSWA